jgi:hypothetical protein
VLVWETRSITPEIESSLYTAEIIRDTELIRVFHSGTLDGLYALLRNRYGEPKPVTPEHDVFAHVELPEDERMSAQPV